jgi:hypothetical protein
MMRELAEETTAEVEETGSAGNGFGVSTPRSAISGPEHSTPGISNTAPISPVDPATPVTPASAIPGIPAFHHQLGQNMPGGAAGPVDRYGISGGQDGQPRQLNFFRAHLFPAVSSGTSTNSDSGVSPPSADLGTTAGPEATASTAPSSTPPADPDAIVPCIFVGVRSVQRETEDALGDLGAISQHQGIPQPGDVGQTPQSPPGTADLTAATTPPPLARIASPSEATTAPRTFRERFLSRLSRRPPLASAAPVNTYLVYVIGGNYPANHPILRIPALLTGAPLTDEDLALISELLGPAKATTVSKEEIERAGLKLVDGATMADLGAKGEVMDNSTERCLICLADYEEGEECRVLACKHGYHRQCVDQWLEKGSNSCPACRSEGEYGLACVMAPDWVADFSGVGNTKSTLSPSTSAEHGASEQLPSLSPPIPVLSVPANGPHPSSSSSHSDDVD